MFDTTTHLSVNMADGLCPELTLDVAVCFSLYQNAEFQMEIICRGVNVFFLNVINAN